MILDLILKKLENSNFKSVPYNFYQLIKFTKINASTKFYQKK